jgi:hypothetical protein
MAEEVSSSMTFPFVDDPSAPEFFVSWLKGAGFDGPNVRLTFVSMRVNHAQNPGVPNEVVNVRLVMSVDAAQNMRAFLDQFLQTAALNAIPRPPGGAVQ